ncbi:hypothetical protein ABZX92_39715 [Lentzea sp. NPDC006480]
MDVEPYPFEEPVHSARELTTRGYVITDNGVITGTYDDSDEDGAV